MAAVAWPMAAVAHPGPLDVVAYDSAVMRDDAVVAVLGKRAVPPSCDDLAVAAGVALAFGAVGVVVVAVVVAVVAVPGDVSASVCSQFVAGVCYYDIE